jgi:hypothetical protein
VQPSEQVTHHRELLRAVGELGALDEPRHEDRAAVEVRYRIIDRHALGGIVVSFEEPQDRGVAGNAHPRASRRKRPCHPRTAILKVDAKHVRLVHAEPRRAHRVDAVTIREVGEKLPGYRLVVRARTETLEIGQRSV